MILFLDQGNSRLKWLLVDHGGRPLDRGVASENLIAHLRKRVEQFSVPIRKIYLSSVAGVVRTRSLVEMISGLSDEPVHVLETGKTFDGLQNGYAIPFNLGVDRWLALVGARSLYCESVVVIDAGTAMTVDVVAANGEHQGGYIVPGLRSQCVLLGSIAGACYKADAHLSVSGLGRETGDAIVSGVILGLAALVDRVIVDASRATSNMVCSLMTGGDAEVIGARMKSSYVYDSDLVFRGMLVSASLPTASLGLPRAVSGKEV